ncbi:MAG: phasin family protein [Deltaproteobacteria bacterium]|nr:phasin family protein [Deltaproteobacteria bacterium]
MLDDVKKGLLTGLGAVVLTKEKIEKIVQKLVDEAKLNKEDARQLQKDLLESGQSQWDRMTDAFSEFTKKATDRLEGSTKKEVHALKEKIDHLEKRVAFLEEKKGSEQ